MENPTGLLWTERYRPRSLEDLGAPESTIGLSRQFIEIGEIPHLLLTGPAGTGKTTLALILIDALDCQVLKLNASKERGIDTIREKVATFSRSRLGARWNIVFLDEADQLTPEAQTALRNLMESYAQRTRFILTGNFLHKILDPIQSRCQHLVMDLVPYKDRFRILKHILDDQEITYDESDAMELAGRYQDMRKLISAAQRMSLGGELDVAGATADTDIKQVLACMMDLDWHGIIRITRTPGYDPEQALKDLFWAIPDDFPMVIQSRTAAAKGVSQMGYAPDKLIHFLGVVGELMEYRSKHG